MAVAFGILFRFLFTAEQLPAILPPVLLLYVGSTTFLFLSSLVIFEKAQGTLGAQTVTPLRGAEYLGAKTLTLSAFAVVEGLVFVLLAAFGRDGTDFALGWFLLGGVSLGVLYTLVGFIAVARHDTIVGFLVPDALVIGTLIQLPILPYFGIWESPLWYLVPILPQLLLFEAAFGAPLGDLAPWELVYAVVYAALGPALAWPWARRAFERHIRGRAAGGGRR